MDRKRTTKPQSHGQPSIRFKTFLKPKKTQGILNPLCPCGRPLSPTQTSSNAKAARKPSSSPILNQISASAPTATTTTDSHGNNESKSPLTSTVSKNTTPTSLPATLSNSPNTKKNISNHKPKPDKKTASCPALPASTGNSSQLPSPTSTSWGDQWDRSTAKKSPAPLNAESNSNAPSSSSAPPVAPACKKAS